jgi:hypothetical protein
MNKSENIVVTKGAQNTYALASPQACPTTTPLLESTSMLPTIISHIPFVIKSGRQGTQLDNFNQGTHFYHKI